MLNKCGSSLFHTCFTKLFAVNLFFLACTEVHWVDILSWCLCGTVGRWKEVFIMIRDLGEWWEWQRVNSTGEKKWCKIGLVTPKSGDWVTMLDSAWAHVSEREGGTFMEQTANRFEFSPLTAQRSRGCVTFSHLLHSSSTVLWRELIPLVTTKM